MTVIYNMSIDRADKPWIGDRRFTEMRCDAYCAHRSPVDTSDSSRWRTHALNIWSRKVV